MKNPFKKEKNSTKDAPAKIRNLQEIQSEYARICAQIGDKAVKIDFLNSEIIGLRAQCRELNEEVNRLPKQEVSTDGTAASPQ